MYKHVPLSGGPWDKKTMRVKPPASNSDPLSLPIRVGEHVGRYNLNTGHWVPSEQQA